MDARLTCGALVLALAHAALGGAYRTQNFIVQTHSAEFARQVGEAAERYRRELAIDWLGHELPPWSQPCPITVQVGPHLGAGGATSFMFDRGVPFGWKMSIQGSAQRVLDSVLPHEVTHTIFATHFGGPLPRWADEGGCTVVEHPDERAKQKRMLYEFLTSGRGIPFNVMFRLKEYPPDILPLYAQGHSLAQYLISQGGKRKFVDFVGHGMQTNDWNGAIASFYQYRNLSDLQLKWVDWVSNGSPLPDANEQFVSAEPANAAPQLGRDQFASLDRGGPLAPAARSAPNDRGPEYALAASKTVPNTSASRGSWYAAQRDAARASDRQARANAPGSSRLAPGSIPRTAVAPRVPQGLAAPSSLARPQGPQQVQEMVLDWGNQPQYPATQGSAVPATVPLTIAPTYAAPVCSATFGGG